MKNERKFFVILIILFIFLILSMGISLMIGSANIGIDETLKIIGSRIPILKNFVDESNINSNVGLIIFKVRLPRIILGSLVGASLAICGAVFQGVFKNPMADPYVLGVSSGAALGATLTIVFGVSASFVGVSVTMMGAFIGSLIATIVVHLISSIGGKTPTTTLLLSGIALNLFLSSLISLMMSLNRDQVERIVFWTMGSLASANGTKNIIVGIALMIGLVVFISHSKDLNLMLLGEDTAKNLGVNTEITKILLMVVASLVTGAAVSVSGIIGFVGIIVPHGVRLIIGPDHRKLLPLSALSGAVFLVITDTFARIIVAPGELPIGVVTSVFGAPYFMLLLYRKKKSLV